MTTSYPDSMRELMLEMCTGGASLMATMPNGWMLQDGSGFMGYGKGVDEKLWFMCIDLLVLWLYSHPKP